MVKNDDSSFTRSYSTFAKYARQFNQKLWRGYTDEEVEEEYRQRVLKRLSKCANPIEYFKKLRKQKEASDDC